MSAIICTFAGKLDTFMQTNTWNFKHGFLMGGGLVVVGLALQMSLGPVNWAIVSWPVNIILMAAMLAIVAAIYMLRKRVYAFQFMGTYQCAVPALAYAVVQTVIMGLTRQHTGASWFSDMLSFWPFVLTYIYMCVILGVIILRRLMHLSSWRRDVPFLLNHLGLFVALTTATLGNADMQRVKMIVATGQSEWRALDERSMVKQMPMAIELKRFIMESYPDGKPKRFASQIHITTKSGKNIDTTIDVNKPYEVDGWKIYQFGYDTQMGAKSQVAILELVSDPWLPLVYTGIFMMLGGALLMVLYTRWRMKRLLPIGLLLVLALAIVSYLMPVVRSKSLVPALQSPWFYPHIFVYIVCYSFMGVAFAMSIWKLVRGQKSTLKLQQIDNMVYVGLIFMTFGMMFGAFWAKEAWGHYWEWDPKETWAAITWLSYLLYIHYRLFPRHKERLALGMIVVSFVLLQMCWWGIRFLPAAQGASVHTY
jgi:cytochrome c biogenesis factor